MYFVIFRKISDMKLSHYFLPFLFLLSIGCKTPLKPVSSTEKLYSVKDTTLSAGTSEIERMLKPYRDSLSGIMNEVIGETSGDLVKEKPGGSLGNLVTDAMYTVAKKLDTNCLGAICNYGGIRIPEIKKGKITKGKIFELLPFENELVILEIKGDVLEQWLNLISESGGWPVLFKRHYRNQEMDEDQVKTIRLIFKDKILDHNIQDNHFHTDSVYHIATNDYIANGGDNCDFLKDQKRTNSGLLLRDIVIEEIRRQHVIKPDNQHRIEFIK